MKIIFLDFDGVICNPSYCIAMGNHGLFTLLEPRSCLLVKKLAQVTGSQIVLSSSWRILMDSRRHCADLLDSVAYGLGELIYKDDQRWRTFVGKDRQQEIKGWIHWFQMEQDEELESFVVLDDCHLTGGDHDPFIYDRMVKTDKYDGFGYGNYIDAEAILTNRLP